jgi:hypothetical protein
VVLEATRESEMKTTSGRTCLILGLLGFALSAALSVDLKARHDGVTVQAHMASTMLLQSSPDSDENAAAPDEDEGAKAAPCAQHGCTAPKPELAFAVVEDRPLHESKAFIAQGDEIRPKSKD